MSLEVFYDLSQLPKCDLFGIVFFETKLNGIINNCPIRRKAVPFLHIDLFKGNDRQIRFLARDSSLNVVDLTGSVCVFSVKENKTDSSFLLQLSTDIVGQGQIGAGDSGEAFFFVTPSDTASIESAQYFFDVNVTLSDGKKYTSVEGYLNLLQPVN